MPSAVLTHTWPIPDENSCEGCEMLGVPAGGGPRWCIVGFKFDGYKFAMDLEPARPEKCKEELSKKEELPK